ncbi:MAG: hypothetical protein WBC04_15505 [Candidatus Acidiferrales bacterium]
MNCPRGLRGHGQNLATRTRIFSVTALLIGIRVFPRPCCAQSGSSTPPSCRIEAISFEGWKAEQISNEWVKLIIVPQLGGRLMQVTFGGHSYLFVNSKYKGQYFPPSEGAAKGHWFNYGGDKIWPMPEGTRDDQHWAGPMSDVLDDGEYDFKALAQDPNCAARLEGPPDPRTGLQYSREISLERDSPKISFHAVMKNSSSHPIEWSMQSVSQYDTADPQKRDDLNRDFWVFTPANAHSAYSDGYRVRFGLADDPSYAVKDGLFTLHWLFLQSEVWIDSPGGWLAVVDGSTRYAMVERFHYREGANYPGKATVIFYKNGPAVELDDKGIPFLTSSNPEDVLHYIEAEINSPMVRLEPGDTYAMDTEWFPTRAGRELKAVADAGAASTPLAISSPTNGILLNGQFGVFFPGRLQAHLYDKRGVELGVVPLQTVSPLDLVDLHQEIEAGPTTARVSVHLIDRQGHDRGSLGEASLTETTRGS